MNWNDTANGYPKEEGACLVVKKGTRYVSVLTWNSRYQSWDDAEGDDYSCEKEGVRFFIPFSDLPDIPS